MKGILETFGLILIPWLFFVGIFCLFTFAYHRSYLVVWFVVFLCIAACVISMCFAAKGRRKNQKVVMGSFLCGVGTVCASVLGLYNYHVHMFAYWSYLDNAVYTNLLPSEPALAHSDAGKVFFSDDARVDTTKAVGYKDESVYCVAPVLDDVPIAKIQFWAVGMDCCAQRADFNCDDAWNPKAKSGVVILDSDSWIPSHRDKYLKAVNLAESTYEILSDRDPVFVRWVAEPEVIQDDFWRSGVGYLCGGAAVYLLVSVIFGGIAKMSIARS